MFDPTSSPDHENLDLDTDEKGSGGHPLFPRAYTETGPDRRRFDWIQVVRYLPDGTREVCPKMWKGSELRSWQQILDDSGGECTYQLGAQTTDHRFTAWSEKAFFASPPRKSFGGGPWIPRQDASNAAPIQQPQSTQDMLLITLVKLLAERRDPPPQPNPVEMFRECAALVNGANRGPNPFEMFKEILPMINRGDNTSRAMQQGIDLARDIYKSTPAVAAAPARSNSDDIGDIMNIFKVISAVRPAATPAPAAAPAPTPQQQNAFAPPCPPPPGYGWMYTQQGWVAFPISMTTSSPVANRIAAPIPQQTPPPPAAPAARAIDEDAWLRAMLGNPETRAKLQALLSATSPTPAPVPHAAPPAPVPAPPVAQTAPNASGVVQPVQAPPAAPEAATSPAHALSDILTASGWSMTPQPAAEAFHYTKPSTEAVAPAVSPAEQAPANSFEIPADVPMDDELRAMLADPAFQEIASSIMPPDAQGAFAQLVQQNALRLQETAEA